MKAIEFYTTPEGEVTMRPIGEAERQLKETDTDFIQAFLAILREFYPEAYDALMDIYSKNSNNKRYRDFIAVRRFIKCNFGLYDNMIDVDENWNFNFEFVGCLDDMVILCADKEALHFVLDMMGLYLGGELKVEIKSNWQIFPVDARSIDYVGFKQNHYGILLRSGILKRFYKKFHRTINKYEIKDETDIKHFFPSEYGWIIRCSEEHSKFIFNNCLNDGSKCFDYRAAG